jgi:hypothetical protein
MASTVGDRPRTSDSGSSESATRKATVHAQLKSDGFDNQEAVKLNVFLGQMYDYIQDHPTLKKAFKDAWDVYDGSKKAIGAAPYKGILNENIHDYGVSGGASVLGVFIDHFSALAKSQGIQLNECALSVAKIATDIGGVGVGAVTSVSGWGVLFLGISIVSTYQDSYSSVSVCSPNGS